VNAIHWRPEKAAQGTTTNYLMLRLETLFDAPLVTFDDLGMPPFSRYRWAVRQSGTGVPAPLADALEDMWEARVKAHVCKQQATKTKRRRT
jgi:hypothetical protein